MPETPVQLGLTGGIAMGKSTAARMFEEAGVPVFDADAAVHALYSGRAAPLVEAGFPGTVSEGVVDRAALSRAVLGNPEALARLEAIVHPLVAQERAAFLEDACANGADLVVFDIPLLFETGLEDTVDRVATVSAPPNIQRERALARPGMTEEKLDAILARQTSDAEKRARADYIIPSDRGLEATRRAIEDVIADVRAGGH